MHQPRHQYEQQPDRDEEGGRGGLLAAVQVQPRAQGAGQESVHAGQQGSDRQLPRLPHGREQIRSAREGEAASRRKAVRTQRRASQGEIRDLSKSRRQRQEVINDNKKTDSRKRVRFFCSAPQRKPGKLCPAVKCLRCRANMKYGGHLTAA